MNYDYWLKQEIGTPLFPDVIWAKPEQKSHAGKLAIIGGNKLGFVSVADNYQVALNAGVGKVKILLPDALKKSLPPHFTDVVFAPTNPSGSLSKEALDEVIALANWADGVLLVGDSGGNAETALVYDDLARRFTGQLTVTRDAIDLFKNSPEALVDREQTTLVASFSQLQTFFKNLYYPKILTHSMNLANFVEAVHKFTITYPVAIVTLHQDNLVIAHEGRVVTQTWSNPMAIWRGEVATKVATWWLWNQTKPLEAAASGII